MQLEPFRQPLAARCIDGLPLELVLAGAFVGKVEGLFRCFLAGR